MADVKGDLSGLSRPGAGGEKGSKRAAETGDDWRATGFPAQFLSLGEGVSSATAGVILRSLLNLEANGGDTFFGEPEHRPE